MQKLLTHKGIPQQWLSGDGHRLTNKGAYTEKKEWLATWMIEDKEKSAYFVPQLSSADTAAWHVTQRHGETF